jgi:hypothetical protein
VHVEARLKIQPLLYARGGSTTRGP